MKKGSHLENEMDRVLKFLDMRGIHGHKNHPKRTNDGTYIEGEPFDYEVFSPSGMWCFDTKECEADAWPLSKAKLSQVNSLMQCARAGCEAFFLVWFVKSRRLIRFDAVLVADSLGKKGSLTPDEGVAFDWQVFLK